MRLSVGRLATISCRSGADGVMLKVDLPLSIGGGFRPVATNRRSRDLRGFRELREIGTERRRWLPRGTRRSTSINRSSPRLAWWTARLSIWHPAGFEADAAHDADNRYPAWGWRLVLLPFTPSPCYTGYGYCSCSQLMQRSNGRTAQHASKPIRRRCLRRNRLEPRRNVA